MNLLLEIAAIVLPVFIVMLLGNILRRAGMIDDRFILQSNRLVFNISLPMLLFYKIGTADFTANFNAALLLGAALAILVGFGGSYAYAAMALPARGARRLLPRLVSRQLRYHRPGRSLERLRRSGTDPRGDFYGFYRALVELSGHPGFAGAPLRRRFAGLGILDAADCGKSSYRSLFRGDCLELAKAADSRRSRPQHENYD